MRRLKITEQYACDTENEAHEEISKFKAEQDEKGYVLEKAGCTYKTKKAKGEVIGEAWIVDVTKTYGGVWDEF